MNEDDKWEEYKILLTRLTNIGEDTRWLKREMWLLTQNTLLLFGGLITITTFYFSGLKVPYSFPVESIIIRIFFGILGVAIHIVSTSLLFSYSSTFIQYRNDAQALKNAMTELNKDSVPFPSSINGHSYRRDFSELYHIIVFVAYLILLLFLSTYKTLI